MRLTLFLLILGAAQLFAEDSYAQWKKFSLDMENVKAETILDEIENLSEFYFLYNQKLVDFDFITTAKFKNKTIFEALDILFKGRNITYQVVGRQIILSDSSLALLQQQKTVTGKVVDENGEPVPGASIVVKGTTTGTISDMDGNFTLAGVPEDAILQFSFVGMRTQEISGSGRTRFDVVMEEETIGLEEVVAVGYGIQKKVDVTGAIATVKGEELAVVRTTDLRDAMQGRLPGVRIKKQSSEPGSYQTAMDIRGLGTPLVIVDGVPRDDFQKIDPNEIESISVLKDASASIYGVRAANGVILITTKKGKVGKTVISLDASYGFEEPSKFAEVLNAGQYAEVMNEALVNAGSKPRYSQQEIDKFYDGNDPQYPNQDWLGALYKKRAPQQNYKLGISGGSEKVQYFISGSYLDQQGLFRSGDLWYKKYNFRANLSASIAENLKANVIVGYIHDNKHFPGPGSASMWGILKAVYMVAPIWSMYANNNPNYLNALGPNQPVGNVVGDSYEKWKGYEDQFNDNLTTNLSLSYDIPFIKGLQLNGLMSYDIISFDRKQFIKPIQTYYYDYAQEIYVPANPLGNSQVNQEFSKLIKPLQQLSLNYTQTINNHKVSTLFVYERQKTEFKRLWGGRNISLPIDQLNSGNIDGTQNVDAQEYIITNEGLIGKLDYDYKTKYLLSASFRYDGSSKFGSENRWGFFPGVSFGWRISEEHFIKDNLSWLDNLKIRGSYGKMGDDAAANSYQWVRGYNYPGGNYILGGSQPTNGLGFKGAINPNITWYTSTMKNIGLEASLWNGKLSAEIDLFRRDRDGLLGYRNLSLPATIGVGLPQENLNSDKTYGYELILGTRNKIGELRYDVKANLTYSLSEVKYVEMSPSNNSYLNWRENPQDRYTGIWWGYKYIGQFQSVDEILQSPLQDNQANKTLLPGDLKYEDFNKDGMIDDKDVQPIGRGQSWGTNIPPYNFGLDINLSMKGFDFSALLQGGLGHKFYLGEQWTEPLRSGNNNVYAIQFDRWRLADPTDPNSEWIPGRFPSTRFGGAMNNRYTSDFWLRDGDYVRLKSLEIGYTLSSNTLRIKSLSSIRIYLNAFNFLTWTKDRELGKIIDPETRGNQEWGYTYPINKSYNFGINITL